MAQSSSHRLPKVGIVRGATARGYALQSGEQEFWTVTEWDSDNGVVINRDRSLDTGPAGQIYRAFNKQD